MGSCKGVFQSCLAKSKFGNFFLICNTLIFYSTSLDKRY